MKRRLFLSIFLFILILTGAGTTFCEVTVGVQKGDWIEYKVDFTGTPPEGHEVTWARSEVVDVQGKVVSLNITTEFSNGTLLNESIDLNLETGQLGDDFIIPANLNVGDTFSDSYHGVVEINATEERSYIGSIRKVITATAAGNKYYWDQTTGILVEGLSQFQDYSIHSIADKTNIWEPQLLGLPTTTFYILLTAATAIIALAAILFALRRKK